jgi:dTDP-glucose 4,6-dehydratase
MRLGTQSLPYMRLLVTGGAGFIGSAFVRHVLDHRADVDVVTLDALTYAGNLDNLAGVEGNPRHRFVRGDIRDWRTVHELVGAAGVEAIVHFAAESHVDRSILSPSEAIDTNVRGTANLLEAARSAGVSRFLHVSTDEVYGDLPDPLEADENFPLRPSSPYAASKASSDLLALAYVRTYGLPVIVTRASNNYGPYQFPEKLIPLMISNALEGLPLPVYGDGRQIRDWLYVDDHCRALVAVLEHGRPGEVYNVAGSCSLPNIEVIERVLGIVGAPRSLLTRVTDRPGHDRRYALRGDKIARDTGFVPQVSFDKGLALTVQWFQQNGDWSRRVKSGAYREYYADNYGWRISSPGSQPAVLSE